VEKQEITREIRGNNGNKQKNKKSEN